MTTATQAWSRRVEAETLDTATKHREVWSKPDIERVLAMTDEARDEDIAHEVGRSLYSVWGIQHRLATGEVDPNKRGHVVIRGQVLANATTCDACFTVRTAAGTCLC